MPQEIDILRCEVRALEFRLKQACEFAQQVAEIVGAMCEEGRTTLTKEERAVYEHARDL